MTNRNEILDHAREIGDLIESTFPKVLLLPDSSIGAVPMKHAEQVAELITDVVAEILQSFLDAGSERDVTLEELGPVIVDHVKGWAK